MKKTIILVLLFVMGSMAPLTAQSVNLKVGLFSLQMKSDLWETNMENLALIEGDMKDTIYAIEYEHFLNRQFSLTFEVSHYEKEHYSAYRDYEYDDGSSINQNLALNLTAMEVNAKFYPSTYMRRFNPYLGGGVGLYYWKYEQWGDFINFDDFTVDEGYADTRTYTLGFNARAGFVLRFKRNVGVSFEARYQFLKGQLSSLFEGFEPLDLNGFSINVGLNLFL